ncbi:MAG: acetyl-CoA carboxylase carboxyltransferase subunit beta [Proteobacteria bacterium]|jgi:acetyl-CoA carboxylase carboxyl transferase subunit beta|nr:acetyl-CoA carboxylase carboxyltransferase subunit beta [Pseudomonadota bacterium]
MGWLSREPARLQESSEKKAIPSGVWEKCSSCNEIVLMTDFEENHRVCPSCGFHARLPGEDRVELLIDRETFYEWDHDLSSADPLEFNDGRSYHERLKNLWKKTRRYDAIITGAGLLEGREVALGVLDFTWMGGSMGTVVGERIRRLFARARAHRMPVILVSSSGGARMHEGLLSLMQMAKTCAAVAQHREAGLPFISVMCDPTTGGVAASYAMLGDINLAEPKATIGFAGRRVIETTIRQKLPDDFQTAEFLLNHGMVDRIVKRSEMKETINRMLAILCAPQDLTHPT